MKELSVLILACILSSIITIFVILFVQNIKAINYKKQVAALFNLVKKNRAPHAKQLKKIITSNSSEFENIDKKIIKFLNLEQAFFIEITKALLNNNLYNVNLLYKSYHELNTYLQLLFADSYKAHRYNDEHNLSKVSNMVHFKEVNNLATGSFKFGIGNFINKQQSLDNITQYSLNDLYKKFYLNKNYNNFSIKFHDSIDYEIFRELNIASTEDINSTSNYFHEQTHLELKSNSIKQNYDVSYEEDYIGETSNNTSDNSEERILVIKKLSDDLEEV